MSIDRTDSFFRHVEASRSRGVQPRGPPKRVIKNESDIHKFTQALCTELRRTGRSVQELNNLARQKGLFNDPSAQIQDLSKAIKENMARHEKSMEQLSTAIEKSTRAKSATRKHWSCILDIIRQHLVNLGKSFQHALRVRSETMKEQQQRRQKFTSSWAPGVKMDTPLFKGLSQTSNGASNQKRKGPPTATKWQPPLPATPSDEHTSWGGAVRRRGNVATTNGGTSSAYSGSGESAIAPRLTETDQFPEDQYSTQQLANYHEAQRRANDALHVESTISELGQMFTRMATLVVEQGETIERIDQDTSVAYENISAAEGELSKYFRMISSDRSLIIKTFLVVIFVILLFSIFR
eukprot:gb/GECG01005863.1/.p1 GENE.gb/GECG01005863.1/~~gb/GECG01005863.1/.p1  ORF type:complete len:351 (+),score=35.73 gb/GECG01005863.1/:1-1053(+)